jgi:hypothetical protein
MQGWAETIAFSDEVDTGSAQKTRQRKTLAYSPLISPASISSRLKRLASAPPLQR